MAKRRFFFDNFIYTLSNLRKFTLFLSLLFFMLFGIAFSLIYLDSVEIKEQINNDFNQQQLILARQASSQICFFLDNLETQFKSLEWFFERNEPEIRKRAIQNLFEQNKDMGILEIGFINYGGKLTDYFSNDSTQTIDSLKIENLFKSNNCRETLALGDLIVEENKSNRSYITSFLSLNLIRNKRIIGTIFSRLDVS